MSRIGLEPLARAITKVRSMGLREKEALADALYQAQPALFASCLAQHRLGVRAVKLEFLLELVLTVFQAMRATGLTWPPITEAQIEQQLRRLVAGVRFGEDLSEALHQRAIQLYIEAHPEKPLLAFVQSQLDAWLKRITPEESDKFVMLAACNFVNCVAFAPLAELHGAKPA